MMEQLCEELDVPYNRIGKLLVAYDQNELDVLKTMQLDAKRNGVSGTELITDHTRLREMEPNISAEILAALYTPMTGVTSPWALVFGLIENALDNGVRLFINTAVNQIEVVKDGFVLETNNGRIGASYIINAAGIYGDKIARLMGDDSFTITGT